MDIPNDLSNFDLSFLMQDVSTADLRMTPELKEYSETVKKKLLDHMRNKYNVEFTLDSALSTPTALPELECRMFLRVPSKPGWRVSASYIEKDKAERYSDNYAAFLLHDNLAKYLADPIKHIFGQGCKAVMGAPRHEVLEKDLGPAPVLEDYIPCAIVAMSIYTEQEPAHCEEDAQRLLHYLKEQGIHGAFTLYYVSPQVLAEIDPQKPMKYEHAALPFLHRKCVHTVPNAEPLEGLDWDMVVDLLNNEYQ